jgi:hypothetical protein
MPSSPMYSCPGRSMITEYRKIADWPCRRN